MQADAFKRLYPEQFYARFIDQGLRPDGRPLGRARATTIGLNAISSADGSALVKIGTTTALASIKLEVSCPSDGQPDEGLLKVNVEFSPLCSPDYRPGKQPEDAQIVSSKVNTLLQRCKLVDLKQLCIKKGQAMWVVNVDVFVLDSNGSVLDAVLLAAIGALSDLLLPAVSVTKEGNVERADNSSHDDSSVQAKRLHIQRKPVYFTCGEYKGHMIADPTREEQLLLASTISVAVDADGSVLDVFKPGGKPASEQMLHNCVEAAKLRYKEVMELLEVELQEQQASLPVSL